MITETRTCQNCKTSFTIEPEDFEFYAKIKVPPPTFCPRCRFQRRLMFRNERVLYRRMCDLCKKSIITVHDPKKRRIVYCSPCWWSDKWDALEFGVEYDPQKNFFEQFRKLQEKIPVMDLVNSYTTLESSEYVNHAGHLKNCYLIFNADYCENVCYASGVTYVKDSLDLFSVGANSEFCYEDIMSGKSSRLFFSEDCFECLDVYFSKDLRGCSHCFGCANLRNKQYHIFNRPYSRDIYEEKLKELRLDSYVAVEDLKKRVDEFWRTMPHRAYHGLMNVSYSGDYLYGCKNVRASYICDSVEDAKYCQFLTLPSAKDLYDLTEWGNGVEMVVDSVTVGEGARDIRFCSGAWANVLDNEYSMFAVSSSHVFGCLSVHKKEYCILNKQYAPNEYRALRDRIVADMNTRPYIDAKGRVWKYGDFFPYDLSFFDYNESTAAQYFTLTKDEALAMGFRWRDENLQEAAITMHASEIPDNMHDISNSIVNEIIKCVACAKPYRIIPQELELLRKMDVPAPRKCPNCRHMGRIARLNPPRLWNRMCAKCGKKIMTSYAPDLPEIVYCEQCYQAEVV
ncbi:MAG: hypothetical protein UX74_C0021G0002 [Parcubacteria group bacterium GW2011_GWA2_47_10b]|nr:MAG: hypothetical protein UX74_C0021G0002 [Parcubacteria group bacterium GW2011_GWA2_47_10b]